jgi:hypothetical protein
MKTQEELFDAIKMMSHKVDGLKGWVQNDFDRMIADGIVTKEDLRNDLDDVLSNFDERIEELNVLKLEVWALIKSVVDKK